MDIHFLGTRGSIPVPGKQTVRYGGNTTCLQVISDDHDKVIIDAGTGIRRLNNKTGAVIFIIITHCHWDHLQGLPFFLPIYNKSKKICFLINEAYFTDIREAIIKQMTGKSFPVLFDQLPSQIDFIAVKDEYQFSRHLKVRLFQNQHPGGAAGLKFINGDKIFTFITDNEIQVLKENQQYHKLLDFCSHADLLVHDAQYLNREMDTRKGYGHSTIEDVVQLFLDTRPRYGVFTHHDPNRTDKEVKAMEQLAKKIIKKNRVNSKILAAHERLVIKL